MPIADFTFGQALLTVIEIFFFVAYLWILITIIGDLFRDHEMSGWGKAAWIVILLIIPLFGSLIYLIARGNGMRDRAIKEQADMQRHMDQYIRQTAGGSSSVDELAKLSELKDKGHLSDAEFEQAKAKLLT
jgi:ABC-type multidrug transport system fused ATPase/permease subunit